MPVYQVRNSDLDALRQPDLHGYNLLSEPVGGMGIWNGSFEQGPGGQFPAIENWTVGALGAGCTIVRYALDRYDGTYCVRATVPGTGVAAGYLDCNRWFPVNENNDYYADFASNGSAGAVTTVRFRAFCYSAARAYLGFADIFTGAIAAAWVWRPGVIGPSGVAFVAGTYWLRLSFWFDWAPVVPGWTEVDAVMFGPVMRAAGP